MAPAASTSQAMEAGVKGHTSKDIKIIRTLEFSHAQMNDMCATCHAKLVPLSTDFIAGEKFYDHYDLLTLEHHDFYPDGRDLGENYTFTSWSMSPCLKSGKLGLQPVPHAQRPAAVRRPRGQPVVPALPRRDRREPHGPQPPQGRGHGQLVHRLPHADEPLRRHGRTDHSMRSPTPAATIAYKSPNACNQCHADHDAPWADQWVRKWYPRDYQAEPLRRAALLDAARKYDWKRLPEMLADVRNKQADEIYRNSLVRLLRGCSDPKKWPVLIAALKDESPLVRASAAAGPGRLLHQREPLAAPARHGRSRAAGADPRRGGLGFRASRSDRQCRCAEMAPRGDGRVQAGHGGAARRLGLVFEPGQLRHGKRRLRGGGRGLRDGPEIGAPRGRSHGQLVDGLCQLEAERQGRGLAPPGVEGRTGQRRGQLQPGTAPGRDRAASRRPRMPCGPALKSDPQLAPAAYNLAVILGGKKDLAGAVRWCRKAHDLRPEELKYTQSLAFYLSEKGDEDGAVAVLKQAIKETPAFFEGSAMLAGIYESRGERKAAARVMRDALEQPGFPPKSRRVWEARAKVLEK